jgi:hypothetical protein
MTETRKGDSNNYRRTRLFIPTGIFTPSHFDRRLLVQTPRVFALGGKEQVSYTPPLNLGVTDDGNPTTGGHLILFL